jgi:formyltetrahydrofolate synthetase
MGLLPDAAVIVSTVRALKMHTGRFKIAAGKPLDPRLKEEDLESVELGAVNLEKHIENVQRLGVPAIVAINRFGFDSQAELDLVRKIALRAGALDAQVSEVWEHGGPGGASLARAVIAAAESGSGSPRHLYPDAVHPGQDSGDCHRDVWRGRRGVSARGERQIRQYSARAQQAADLHGQDAVLTGQSPAEGSAG